LKKILLIILLVIVFFSFSEALSPSAPINPVDKMQDFVISISKYARKSNPNFIIIPQNGEELAFTKADVSKKINANYLKAIDGFGIEELFYNETYKPNEYRIENLRKLKNQKPVFVSEYVTDDKLIPETIEKNSAEGFISFARNKDNYHYSIIPSKINNENQDNIEKLNQAKNFLYLINNSNYSSKKEFLTAIANTNYDVVFIDLFFNKAPFSSEEIKSIQTKANGSKRLIIAYMNIGAAEKYRYYWQKHWTINDPSWLKKKYDGYENEVWVEYWNEEWQDIIYGNDDSYTRKVIDAGFDGVYLDNVEAYYFLTND